MSIPKTAPVPDFYGNTIFCDDIRLELDGKVTYVGAYNSGVMLVRASFPLVIPKFCFAIAFYQRKDLYVPSLGLRVFVPGDGDEKASIEADLQGPIVNDPQPKNLSNEHGVLYHMASTNMVLSPFTIEQPGLIKVRVLREGVLYRVGSLRIMPFPDAEPTSTTAS
jgi:hypothetical protein